MKQISLEGFGGPEVLTFTETDIPQPASHDIVVKVHAIGVNRADILQREGKYPPPKGESDIPGLEIAGEIISVGREQPDTLKGKRVAALVAGGGYAEYALVRQGQWLELPDDWSFVEGAGLIETFITAWQTLFDIAQLQAGQRVLIHAGASGVGTSAIQLAKQKGCWVATTVSNDEKAERCKQLGADLTINYNESSFAEIIKAQGKGVDIVLDCVAGEYLNDNVKCLNMDGQIVVIAMLGGRFTHSFDMARLIMKRGKLQASTLRNQSDSKKQQLIKDFASTFGQALKTRQILPVIDSSYDWHNITEAHQRIESNQNIGKVVLTVI